MHVSQLALERRLLGHERAERRPRHAQQRRRHVDHAGSDEARRAAGAGAQILLGAERHQVERRHDDVENRLGQLRVHVRQVGAERRQIVGEALIGVAHAVVEVQHAVVDLATHVVLGGVRREARAERRGQHRLEVLDQRVAERRRQRNEHPLRHELHEEAESPRHQSAHQRTVEVSDVKREERARHQRQRVQRQQRRLARLPRRQHNAQQIGQLCIELLVVELRLALRCAALRHRLSSFRRFRRLSRRVERKSANRTHGHAHQRNLLLGAARQRDRQRLATHPSMSCAHCFKSTSPSDLRCSA